MGGSAGRASLPGRNRSHSDSTTDRAGHSPLHALRSTMSPQQPSPKFRRHTSAGKKSASPSTAKFAHSCCGTVPTAHPHSPSVPATLPQHPSPRSTKQSTGIRRGASRSASSSGGINVVSKQPHAGTNPPHDVAGRLPIGHTSQLSLNTGEPQHPSPKSCTQLSGTSQGSSHPATRHSERSIIPEGHASHAETSVLEPSQQPSASAAKHVFRASQRFDLDEKQPPAKRAETART